MLISYEVLPQNREQNQCQVNPTSHMIAAKIKFYRATRQTLLITRRFRGNKQMHNEPDFLTAPGDNEISILVYPNP